MPVGRQNVSGGEDEGHATFPEVEESDTLEQIFPSYGTPGALVLQHGSLESLFQPIIL